MGIIVLLGISGESVNHIKDTPSVMVKLGCTPGVFRWVRAIESLPKFVVMNNCIVALSILKKTAWKEAEVFDVECLVYGEDGLSTKTVLKVYEPYTDTYTPKAFRFAEVDRNGVLVGYKVSRDGRWMFKKG